MARSGNAISVTLVIFSCGSLAYGLWALADTVELGGLYWLVTGALALAAANDREQSFAAR
jgi:hypothetical protein